MANKHSIKFLSYNLYCLPWIATAFSPSSCPLSSERSTHFLQHIPSYDILALQEVWDPRYKTLERFASQNKLHSVGSSAPSAGHFFTGFKLFGGGLMIISKHPIVDTREVLFDEGTHSDKFVTKGVLYAKIKVGSSFVHVFNTHLQASYGFEFKESDPYAGIRNRQLKKLVNFVKTVTAKDDYPIMLAGDFNVNARASPEDGADSKEYLQMLEILQAASFQVNDILKEHNGGQHPVTYGGNGVTHGEKPKVGGQRLDFILELKRENPHKYNFLEGMVVPFKVSEQIFTHISDHYAQSVIMEMHVDEEDGANASGLSGATIVLGAE